MRFIELTDLDNEPFYVNTDKIITFGKNMSPKRDGSTFVTVSEFEESLYVVESVDEVFSKICTVQGR